MPITNRAYIEFTEFMDPENIWASKEALNAWFHGLYINMASVCVPGVVRQATGVEYAPVTIEGDFYDITVESSPGVYTTLSLVTKARYDTLEADHNALKAAFQTLVTNLVNSGLLSNDPDEVCT
jgi:hypothetical protein